MQGERERPSKREREKKIKINPIFCIAMHSEKKCKTRKRSKQAAAAPPPSRAIAFRDHSVAAAAPIRPSRNARIFRFGKKLAPHSKPIMQIFMGFRQPWKPHHQHETDLLETQLPPPLITQSFSPGTRLLPPQRVRCRYNLTLGKHLRQFRCLQDQTSILNASLTEFRIVFLLRRFFGTSME